MTTFDRWEAELHPPEDYLMHFRTKGSKNGVRRYQTASGEWTELGLQERRKREGFGESKQERKAQKKVERAERKLAKKEARAERKAARAEAKRKRTLKGLTDDEMKKKLERAKMEAEYREISKRGSLVETGAKLVSKYLEYKNNKEQRIMDLNRQKIEMEKLKTQQIQAKEQTKQSENRVKTSGNEARTAEQQARKMEADVKGGLKIQRRTEYKRAKIGWRNGTIRGGIQQKIHDIAVARGEGRSERIKERAFTSGVLRNRKRVDRYNKKLDPWQQQQSYDPDPWNRKKNKK